MSELTRCNYCTYKDIQERYGKEKVSFRLSIGEMRGWVEVNVKGKRKPVAYFMQLTAHCVC
jgi:hypothetical protein